MIEVDTVGAHAPASYPAVAAGPAAAPADLAWLPALPIQPKSVRDTGLDQQLLVELLAKSLLVAGKTHLPILTGKLRLSLNVLREVLDFMAAEHMVEVAWRGDADIDVQYQLTSLGKQRAADYLARCRYLGPAPVTLEAYRSAVQRQSQRRVPVQARLLAAQFDVEFADDPCDEAVRQALGAAMHAGRSLLLYGPSGSGKSTLARKLGRLLQGLVAVPYAILVDGQIVQFHDPLLHIAPSPLQQHPGGERRSSDARWLLCQRPVVQVGAELNLDTMDLRHDAASGIYHAPAHLKANNGMFIVDDLGRQRVGAAELFNRWAGPLDLGQDQLSMYGGHKVSLPFDAALVLATNLAPAALLDASALRRIGYKVRIGALGEAAYRKLFRYQCRVARIVYDEAALRYLLDCLHAPSGQPLLASTPRELLGRIADFAGYADQPARLSAAALDQAWTSLFAACTPDEDGAGRPA